MKQVLLCGFVVLSIASCTSGRTATVTKPAVEELTPKERIRRLRPWRTTYYPKEGWIRALELARDFQRLSHEEAIHELVSFSFVSNDPTWDSFYEGTKPLLLMRLVFRYEINENVPHIPHYTEEGIPSWPIEWKDGLPTLASPKLASFGGRYIPHAEYEWCSEHLEFRNDLDEIIERLKTKAPEPYRPESSLHEQILRLRMREK